MMMIVMMLVKINDDVDCDDAGCENQVDDVSDHLNSFTCISMIFVMMMMIMVMIMMVVMIRMTMSVST